MLLLTGIVGMKSLGLLLGRSIQPLSCLSVVKCVIENLLVPGRRRGVNENQALQCASCTLRPADAERISGDFAPRERRPASPGHGQARTAVRAARLSAQLPGSLRPAPPASCIPHARTALESRPFQTSKEGRRDVDVEQVVFYAYSGAWLVQSAQGTPL